jgi:CelD/BcsL family acetyltransferase involved in cellulose biosynthesis
LSEAILKTAGIGSVFVGALPPGLGDRMSRLYRSPYSTSAYFALFFPPMPRYAWQSEDPPNVVEFGLDGTTAVVLNGVFWLDGRSLKMFCTAVFEALPSVDRIRFRNLDCDPSEVDLPYRIDRQVDDSVVDLPDSEAAYLSQLGASTRKNVRRYARRLQEASLGLDFRVAERRSIDQVLVSEVIALNRRHWEARGAQSGIDALYEQRLHRLLRLQGLVGSLSVDGTLAAGWLGARVCDHVYFLVTGYHEDFAGLHAGFLSCYWTLEACIGLGVRRAHFLWGESDYKRRFGAVARDLYFITVFRGSGVRWVHPREEFAYRLRHVRAATRPLVSMARRANARAIRATKELARDPDDG